MYICTLYSILYVVYQWYTCACVVYNHTCSSCTCTLHVQILLLLLLYYSVFSFITQLLPTPAKSHYTFNLRDLSKVFQGILMGRIQKLNVSWYCVAMLVVHVINWLLQNIPDVLKLWYHECCRVFQDRLVNSEDRNWFESLLCSKMVDFGIDHKQILGDSPVLYGDFVSPADPRLYEEITDIPKVNLA